jgi:hypothetical protein
MIFIERTVAHPPPPAARVPGDAVWHAYQVRALEAAGLLIEALREPRAPDGLIARDPAERRWQRIPMFLHARAVKP